MTGDLKTHIWVGALIRRAEIAGCFAAVVRKGDPDAGAVAVKAATLDGRARLYVAGLRGEGGERVWMDLSAGALGDEERAVDLAIARRIEDDPDLWVVEIEDKQGRNFLMERVE